MTGKKLFKIIFISFISMIIRILFQLIIPSSEQSVFKPSIFVQTGTLPIVFFIYGTLTYFIISIIFFVINNRMAGTKLFKGLKIAFIYASVWVIFLLEPLPHAANTSIIELISYPLADGIALLIIGLLCGNFLFQDSQIKENKLNSINPFNIFIITLTFIMGRIVQYKIFNIYSLFTENPIKTILWVICTGIIIGFMFEYLNYTIKTENIIKKSLIFGFIYFGINLTLFNFFMPLVLQVNIIDLIVRTAIDIIFVSIGCFIINKRGYV